MIFSRLHILFSWSLYLFVTTIHLLSLIWLIIKSGTVKCSIKALESLPLNMGQKQPGLLRTPGLVPGWSTGLLCDSEGWGPTWVQELRGFLREKTLWRPPALCSFQDHSVLQKSRQEIMQTCISGAEELGSQVPGGTSVPENPAEPMWVTTDRSLIRTSSGSGRFPVSAHCLLTHHT